ncbi:hypothetical protein DXG01_005162 [Tephrocybe rancida]|nr:hypothetical protein DXG01_005162 [Tephrocybe rancida]
MSDAGIPSGSHPARPNQGNSGTSSTSNTTGTAGNTSTSPPIALNGKEQEIIKRLDAVIEDFRSGKKSKGISVTEIVHIASESALPKEARQDSITSYVTILDSIEKKQEERGKRARQRDAQEMTCLSNRAASPRSPSREQGEQSPNADGHSRSPSPGTIHKLTHEFIESVGEGKRKRRNQLTDDEGSSLSESDSDEDGEKPKKKRISSKDLPWFAKEKIARLSCDPRCIENHSILRKYLSNVSGYKK